MEKPDLKWMTTGGTPSLGIPPFIYPLVICYIAMEHGPFIDGLHIKNGDFPWLSQTTRWYLVLYLFYTVL